MEKVSHFKQLAAGCRSRNRIAKMNEDSSGSAGNGFYQPQALVKTL